MESQNLFIYVRRMSVASILEYNEYKVNLCVRKISEQVLLRYKASLWQHTLTATLNRVKQNPVV